jgi:hypothetical protein
MSYWGQGVAGSNPVIPTNFLFRGNTRGYSLTVSPNRLDQLFLRPPPLRPPPPKLIEPYN